MPVGEKRSPRTRPTSAALHSHGERGWLALGALTEVLPDFVRTGGELEYVDSFLVRGPAKLELATAAAT